MTTRSNERKLAVDATTSALLTLGIDGVRLERIAALTSIPEHMLWEDFDSREGLVAATIAHLFEQVLITGFLDLERSERTVEDAIDVLWSIFDGEQMRACMELYAAAYRDEELRGVLVPALAKHRANVRAIAHDLFGSHTSPQTIDLIVRGAMALMHGAALLAPISGGEAVALEFLRGGIRSALALDALR